MNWRQAVVNWSLAASWFEIFDFMNWIAQFHQCRRQFMHHRCNSWRSQFMPTGQFIAPQFIQEIIKNAQPELSIFCKFRQSRNYLLEFWKRCLISWISWLYSLRATPLVWRCFALRFAFRKTLAEQSALARLQASLQTRFVWLSWISWVR